MFVYASLPDTSLSNLDSIRRRSCTRSPEPVELANLDISKNLMALRPDSPHDAIRRILAECFSQSVRPDTVSTSGQQAGLELTDSHLKRALTLRQELVHAVDLEVRAIKTQRNLHASIHKLPVELLVYIFQLALPSPRAVPHYIQSLDTLLHVCTHWGTVINNAPSLWTVMTSICGSHYLALTLAKLGNTYPLHIHCNLLSEPEFDSILSQISPHIHRWETAIIPVPQSEEGRRLLSVPAPKLRRLYLSALFGTGLEIEANAQPFNIFNGSADQLEELTVRLTCVPWSSPILRGLQSLSLYVCTPIRVGKIIAILTDCPDLSTLELLDTEITVDMQPDPLKAINMPMLEKISFDAELEGIKEVFNGFKAPNCQIFALDVKRGEPGEDTEGFLLNTLTPFFPFFRRAMLQYPKTILNHAMPDVFNLRCGYHSEDTDALPLSLYSSNTSTHVMTAFLRQVLGEDQPRKPDVRLVIGRDWGTEAISIMNGVSSCCNVVDLWLGGYPIRWEFDADRALRALAKPTVLPNLRHLIIAGDGWDGGEIRAILQKRYKRTNESALPLRIRLVGTGADTDYTGNLVQSLEQIPMIEKAHWRGRSRPIDKEDM